MSGLDIDLVNRKLAEIKRLLSEIKKVTNLDIEEFLSDPYIKDATKYKLIVAIEASISVCNHIVARELNEIPSSYSDCFTNLGNHKIISDDLAKELASMAKFRNLVVHVYWRVDDKKVFEIAQEIIVALERFVQEVGEYVNR
ncbi:MAG: type VII toxin-antitoxin system HepT family RNase toxin [Candidatus Thorarchaeota archaeon]